MKYYKELNGGYILGISTGNGSVEISENEYNKLLGIIQDQPVPPTGFDYRLRIDLTWELYELPPEPPADEPATSEDYEAALNRLGVET